MIVAKRIETYLKALGLWVLFFGVSVQSGIGQNAYDNNWLIGYGAFSDALEVARFNFDDGVYDLQTDTIGAKFRGQNLVMSDREGDLLFYSNGCKLWNANQEVIPGSDPLLPGEFHEEWCVGGFFKGMPRKSTMIGLPFELSADSTIYYIYHVRDSFVEEPFFTVISFLREHAVLHTDSGLEVLYTDSAVTNSRTYAGFFTAIRHANKRDWWMIHPIEDSVAFEAILINEDGSRGGKEFVTSPYPPPLMELRHATSGQMVANQNGTKLVNIIAENGFFSLTLIERQAKSM